MHCHLCQEAAADHCTCCHQPVCLNHLRALDPVSLFCTTCADKITVCLRTGHDWGPSKPVPEKICLSTHTCIRCGHTEIYETHKWLATGRRDHVICMDFVCQTCGKESASQHQFRVAGSRSEAYVCQACGYVVHRHLNKASR